LWSELKHNGIAWNWPFKEMRPQKSKNNLQTKEFFIILGSNHELVIVAGLGSTRNKW
jgi:hypothetical protein